MSRRSDRSRGAWAWWAVALLALIVGLGSLVGMRPAGEPRVVVLSGSGASVARPASFPAVPHSRPVELSIPAIDVTTYVGALGLQPDHEVMVPTSTHVVGWFDQGPTPGSVGSAVILGHVDSYLGPGTFFNLKLLKAGDLLTLKLADGTVTHFEVSRVVQYSKTSFPDRLVYGSRGTRSLQLVTCGGVFDHETGHYEANVVVFTHLVSVSVPKGDVAR
jgi:sortase (surface protein transpeptidase)